jgi:hypothetical protein
MQSAAVVQAPVLQAVAEAHVIDPAHAVGGPAVHVWLVLHVLLVSIELAHEGVPQSEAAAA